MNHFKRHREFYRMLLALSVPVALQNLLTTSMSMIDTLMVGALGETTLAAVGICNQFTQLLFSAYWGFASGGTLFFAQFWGTKNEKGICRSYGITLTCMMAVGLLFCGAAVFAPEMVLRLYTDKEAVQAIGVNYLRIAGLSYPLQVIAMAISCMLRSTEKVRLPLIAPIASMLTNTALNWLLIGGNLGCPALGAEGAAIATCAGALANVAVLFIGSMKDPHSLLTRLRDQFTWTGESVRAYFLKCMPIIVNELGYGVGQMIVNIVLGHQDEAGIAAVAIFRVVEGFIFSFYVGLTNACSVIIGKSVGSGELKTAYQDARRISVICPLVTLLICLIVLIARPLILSLFTLSDVAYAYVMIMLVIYTVSGTLRTASYNAINTFRVGGEPFIGACFEVGTLFLITVPLIWLSGMVWRLPFLLVFGSMYVEEVAKFIITTWFLNSGRWIRPVTPEGAEALPAFRAWLKLGRAEQ